MANVYFEVVDGYIFHSPEEANRAKKELQGIQYVKKQLDMSKPETVLQIYNQILKEQLFSTAVRYGFLRELQEYLKCSPEIVDTEIRPLDISATFANGEKYSKTSQTEILKNRFSVSVIANIILGFVVLAMMVLMYFSDNATIINYENKIIDRYEMWEKELEEREEAVKQKEIELGIQP